MENQEIRELRKTIIKQQLRIDRLERKLAQAREDQEYFSNEAFKLLGALLEIGEIVERHTN